MKVHLPMLVCSSSAHLVTVSPSKQYRGIDSSKMLAITGPKVSTIIKM